MAGATEYTFKSQFKFVGLFGVIVSMLMFVLYLRDPGSPNDWPLMVVFEALFLSISLGLYIHGRTKVLIDDDHISLSLSRWSRKIEWRNLHSYELGGKLNGTAKLTSIQGTRIKIEFSSVNNGLVLAEQISAFAGARLVEQSTPKPELPIVCTMETRRELFIAAGVMILVSLLPLTILFVRHSPRDVAPIIILVSLLIPVVLLCVIQASVKLTLLEDRVVRTTLCSKRQIHLCNFERLIITRPVKKPGAPRYSARIQFFIRGRRHLWGLPYKNSEEFIEMLPSLVRDGIVEFDQEQAERVDLEGRKARAKAALTEEMVFKPLNRWALGILATVYLPIFTVPLVGAAFTVRNVPGYEILSWSCIALGTTLFVVVIADLVAALTTIVSIGPTGVRKRNWLLGNVVAWDDVKSVRINGVLYAGSAAELSLNRRSVRLAGLERQWFVNDLVAAHAKARGIAIDDRSKPEIPM